MGLSTHALMRGAVLQLHRWGLLDAIRASGAAAIHTTTFHEQRTLQLTLERDVDSGETVSGLSRIDVGSARKQRVHHVPMSAPRRDLQWREPRFVRNIDEFRVL